MSITEHVFHLLDIQARDIRIESEQDDVREIAYESHSDSDEEYKTRKRKKVNTFHQRKEFVIHLFGADEIGKPIRCDVTGFRPTLYLRLPEEKTSQASETIKQYINSQGIPIGELNIKRITKKVFYGFTANSFYPFLQIDVPSLTLFRNIRNLFLDENLNPMTKRALGIKVEVFEANIDPMLRFIHTQNIEPCGWVLIKSGQISEDEYGKLIQSNSAIKENLKTWLNKSRMINDTIDILDADILNLGIEFEVVGELTMDKREVLNNSLFQIKQEFSRLRDIGEPFFVTDVYKALKKAKGVLDVTDVKVTCKNGGLYSDIFADISQITSPDGRYVDVPMNSIFEIKYPDNDIKGSVK